MSRLHVVRNILMSIWTLWKWLIYSLEVLKMGVTAMILKQLIIIFYCGIFQGQELLDKVCGWIFLGSKITNWMSKLCLSSTAVMFIFPWNLTYFDKKLAVKNDTQKILEFASDKMWDYFCIMCVVLKNPAQNCYQAEDCRSENTKIISSRLKGINFIFCIYFYKQK